MLQIFIRIFITCFRTLKEQNILKYVKIKIMSGAAFDNCNLVEIVKCSTFHYFRFRQGNVYCRKVKLR